MSSEEDSAWWGQIVFSFLKDRYDGWPYEAVLNELGPFILKCKSSLLYKRAPAKERADRRWYEYEEIIRKSAKAQKEVKEIESIVKSLDTIVGKPMKLEIEISRLRDVAKRLSKTFSY